MKITKRGKKFFIGSNHKLLELNEDQAKIFFSLCMKRIENKKLYLAILGRLFDKENKKVECILHEDLEIDLYAMKNIVAMIYNEIDNLTDEELYEFASMNRLIEAYISLTRMSFNSAIDNYPLYKVDIYSVIMDSIKTECIDEILDSQDYVKIIY